MNGIGTSAVLKDRLEKTIPGNEYHTCSMEKVLENHKDYDVILTFKELAPYVEKMLKDEGDYKLKTVEGFNNFAKELFNDYLLSD
jgi:galactitol-specific phosphotransferase system IIB component